MLWATAYVYDIASWHYSLLRLPENLLFWNLKANRVASQSTRFQYLIELSARIQSIQPIKGLLAFQFN